MIRRSVQLDDGTPAWLLVRQQDHAAMAAELSRHARPLDVPGEPAGAGPLEAVRDEVDWAVRHHDDGWQAWDAAPGLSEDPPGRPRSFDEMRVEDANAIWARSIERAGRRGPLAAWLVTRHFLYLRSVSSSVRDPAAVRFAATFEPRAEDWWRAWTGTAAAAALSDPAAAARQALDRLRWADRLSLCLCSDPPANGNAVVIDPSPVGQPQRLTWVSAGAVPSAPADSNVPPGDESIDFRFGYRLQPWLADPDPSRAPARLPTPEPPTVTLRWQGLCVPRAVYASVQELNRVARRVGILGVLGG